MPESNKPAYLLIISEKPTETRDGQKKRQRSTLAGAAWRNPIGGLNISLNPGIVLDASNQDKYWFSLKPHGEVIEPDLGWTEDPAKVLGDLPGNTDGKDD